MATLESKWNFDLCYVIEHAKVGGKSPPVDVANRQAVIETLEGVVLHYETRDDYFADVKVYSGGKFARVRRLDESLERRIVTMGLAAASNEELAELALNPLALWQLADAVREEFPRAWWESMSRVSRQLMESDDVKIEVPPELALAGRDWERPLPAPAAEFVGVRGESHVTARSRRIRADECEWKRGDPSMVGDQVLTIAWRWDEATHSLRVQVTGFVKLGDDARITIGWKDRAGRLRADEQSPVNPQFCLVFLYPKEGAMPASDDQLTVTHCWKENDPEGWEFVAQLPLEP